MSQGGFRARVDALMGGPGRRQREMLRRLEELDRLDRLAADPEVVLWPDGRSSRVDPRAWTVGPTAPPPRTPGSRRTAVLAIALAIGLAVGVPRISGWVQDVVAGPPAAIPGVGAGPAPAGRLLPAVTGVKVAAASQYSVLHTQEDGSGEPVTFDPCRAIHYVVRDAHGAGAAGREAITRAVAVVSAATGLAFVDDGDTTEPPHEGRADRRPGPGAGWAPVLIAWSDPRETPALAGDVVGVGGGLMVVGPDGRRTYVTGDVTLDAPTLLDGIGGPRGAALAESVVVHELAHVLGAGHSEAGNQLMAPRGGAVELGTGDRYVLSVLGQGRCVPGL